MHDLLFERIYGCLIGGAIGDALGAPVEKWHHAEIARRFGKMDELRPSLLPNTGTQYLAPDPKPSTPGQITDDTTARHYVCLAIVERGGRITPDDLARVWLERLNPDRLFHTERLVIVKLRMGMNPWETGAGLPGASNAMMAIAPVGLVNAADPRQAYTDAFAVGSMMSAGPDRDACATMAAGVAAAIAPGASVEDVIDAMLANSSFLVRRAIVRALDLVERTGSIEEFTAAYYEQLLDWTYPTPPGEEWTPGSFSAASLESLPAIVGLLRLCGDDPTAAVVAGAGFGRDCDTIASLLGNVCGALHGAGRFPRDWIEQCETANADFFREVEGDPARNFASMAERLCEVLRQEREAAEARLDTLRAVVTTADAAYTGQDAPDRPMPTPAQR